MIGPVRRRLTTAVGALALLSLLGTSRAASAATIAVVSQTANAGSTVSVPLTFSAEGARAVAIGIDMQFPSQLTFVSAAASGGKLIEATRTGSGSLSLLIYTSGGSTVIGDGVLANVTFSISSSATGSATISLSGGVGQPFGGVGGPISIAGIAGTVTIASTCPTAPAFVNTPAGAVTAGNVFTLAWTAVVASDPGGTYQVDLSTNGSCSSPKRITTSQASLTVSTEPAKNVTYCAIVRAVSGSGCVGDASSPVTVNVQAPPPTFIVLQPQRPEARVELNGALPASTVIFRNVGASAGTLSLTSTGGFFSASPASFSSVPPGGDVTADIQLATGSSSSAGVKSGVLTGSWNDSGIQQVSTPITLTVLSGAATAGGKLQPGSLNEVHFRQRGGTPPNQSIEVVNTGSQPVRIAPSIGPGGAWLSITGDFGTPLPPGQRRSYTLRVDRSRRTTSDGKPPIVTQLRLDNVDGSAADAASYSVFDEEPPDPVSGTNRPALTQNEFSLILGSSVSAESNGSTFLSDGWIRNRGSDAASVDLYYTPNGADGIAGSSVKKTTLSLEPYSTYRLADFVQGLFQASGTSGQIEVRSKALSQLSVRTTVDTVLQKSASPQASRSTSLAGDGVSTRYGAEIPILVTGQGASKNGDTFIVLPGVRGPEAGFQGFRTNVILAETSGKPVDVSIKLFNPDGQLVGQTTLSVPAYSKNQVNSNDGGPLFPGGSPFDGGTITVTPTSGAGTIAAFATVISNASGSYLTRVGQVLPTSITTSSSVPTRHGLTVPTEAYIPAATRALAANNSFYTTRVVICNLRNIAVHAQLTFVPADGGPPPPTQDVIIKANSGGAGGPPARVFDDVVSTLFGLQQGVGMIRVQSAALYGLSIGSETNTPLDPGDLSKGYSISALNPAPGGGANSSLVGVFYAAADADGVVGTLDSGAKNNIATIPAIEESSAFRTNLILAELSGQPMEVRVTLTPATAKGNTIGSTTYSLRGLQRLQVGNVIANILGASSSASYQDVEIRIEAISGSGRVIAIATKIDNNPLSKRADIFTLGPNVDNR